MKKLLIFFFTISLFSANLINVDFFSHKKFVDVLFSLDDRFNGKIIKLGENRFLIKNIYSNKLYIKSFHLQFLKTIKIFPKDNGIAIDIKGSEFSTKFDLTPEGYGLRLRIVKLIKPSFIKTNTTLNSSIRNNPIIKVDYLTYILIILILIVLAILLFFMRKKVNINNSQVKILIQKPIDVKNKLVLFEFNDRKYLVLVGNTNLLIDVFDKEMNLIRIENEFDKKFDEILKLNNKLDEFTKRYIENAEKLKEFDERI